MQPQRRRGAENRRRETKKRSLAPRAGSSSSRFFDVQINGLGLNSLSSTGVNMLAARSARNGPAETDMYN